jgi:hypothetical protein
MTQIEFACVLQPVDVFSIHSYVVAHDRPCELSSRMGLFPSSEITVPPFMWSFKRRHVESESARLARIMESALGVPFLRGLEVGRLMYVARNIHQTPARRAVRLTPVRLRLSVTQ